ncbi:DUF2778 domain-containing protein [Burkholderia territorii]|uniref:DUF2778 domain-containing protein n=1 Tax=Burkholderia territorii TaxID=1503055 RepID=UPI0009C0E3A5|nr:DUF2778 domain-containing protein [Burkholderia territorii]
MAYTGRFLVNNDFLSPLTIDGLGTFDAFSGNGIYRNRGGCTAVPDNGPIPAGKYWIVDRPTGGVGSRAWTSIKDAYNALKGRPSYHSEWFALYRSDRLIDDFTWINGLQRGQFRLHPTGGDGISLGCITLPSRTEFLRIRTALLTTDKIAAGNSGLDAYGTIEVLAYGNTCP